MNIHNLSERPTEAVEIALFKDTEAVMESGINDRKRAEIEREIAHLTFELDWRYNQTESEALSVKNSFTLT